MDRRLFLYTVLLNNCALLAVHSVGQLVLEWVALKVVQSAARLVAQSAVPKVVQ